MRRLWFFPPQNVKCYNSKINKTRAGAAAQLVERLLGMKLKVPLPSHKLKALYEHLRGGGGRI